jgi:apolipoprotein N-acyltransferase
MRTLIITAIGILVGLLTMWVIRKARKSPRTAFLTFAILWFAFCAYNMWVGVSSAGYAVTEELPFLAINFLVPLGIVFALRKRIGLAKH